MTFLKKEDLYICSWREYADLAMVSILFSKNNNNNLADFKTTTFYFVFVFFFCIYQIVFFSML